MKYYTARENPHFVGRQAYWQRLREIDAQDAAAVVVVYGRRRIGKTELIEQFFRNRPILKFEGLQPARTKIKKSDPTEKRRQIEECLVRLDRYTESANVFRRMKLERWSDFFEVLLPYVEKAPVALYFDELQWLANYGDDFLSEFKPFWDDSLRHNPKLRVVVSGSSPSFIVNQFLSTSAMYNRSNHMLKLEPFEPDEIRQFLQKGPRETLLAAIAVGRHSRISQAAQGRPVRLRRLVREIVPAGRILQDGEGPDFRQFPVRQPILRRRSGLSVEAWARHPGPALQGSAPGKIGVCRGQFHAKSCKSWSRWASWKNTHPLTAANPRTSRLARYAIADEYLHFYYRFIDNKIADIDAGKFTANPTAGVQPPGFQQTDGVFL